MDRDDPQLHPRFPRGNLGLPPPEGGARFKPLSQGHEHRPRLAPAQAGKEGPDLSVRAPAPDPVGRKGGPSAHHCAPRWSVVLIKAPSSDFWVSASGRSQQPPPSAISSVSPALPARTSASRTACCGPRPRTHARTHTRMCARPSPSLRRGPQRLPVSVFPTPTTRRPSPASARWSREGGRKGGRAEMKSALPPPGRFRRLVAVRHPFSCPTR